MKTPPVDLANRLREASADILRLDAEPNFDEISERTGVARATLYYYFSGRDDLYAFLLTTHLAEGAALFPEANGDEDPAQRLRAVLQSIVEFLASKPGVCAGLLAALGSGMHMNEVLEANDRVIGAPLRRILREGQAAGVFVFDDDTDTANALLGAILSAVLGRAIGNRPLDETKFHEQLAGQLVRSVAVG